MTLKDLFLCATALIYNAAVIILMAKCLGTMDLGSMLREKRPGATSPSTAPAPALEAAHVAVVSSGGDAPSAAAGNSYSRITGCAGSVILAAFVWSVGNAVIYNSFADPASVKGMLDGVAPFILASSALFAPYAFNQLSALYPARSS